MAMYIDYVPPAGSKPVPIKPNMIIFGGKINYITKLQNLDPRIRSDFWINADAELWQETYRNVFVPVKWWYEYRYGIKMRELPGADPTLPAPKYVWPGDKLNWKDVRPWMTENIDPNLIKRI